MHEDADRLLAEREAQLEAELAELTKPPGEVGTISFGKRVGEGRSIARRTSAARPFTSPSGPFTCFPPSSQPGCAVSIRTSTGWFSRV
jgi:hypothetical protein